MSGKIIIVDDDPMVGNLTLELLLGDGLDAELISDSLLVVEAVKEKKPVLVILDILMPGVDGLTLCRIIKSEAEFKGIKVAVVSGKDYVEDKQRALNYGADLFIQKPYDVGAFAPTIRKLIGLSAGEVMPEAPQAAAAEPARKEGARLKAKIWGCRSLSPRSGDGASKTGFGYKTSCVSVEYGERRIIFDAGTGIKDLGQSIMEAGPPGNLWLFLSHFHKDHVEGLGTFPCAQVRGATLNIGASAEAGKSLEELLQQAFAESSSPLARVAAEIQPFELREESYDLFPGTRLTPFYANHPGHTLGYVLEAEGTKIVYCPDSELYGETGTALQDYDQKLGGLTVGADLLIHDGRYTDDDYHARRNNGHSSWLSAVDFAGRFRVKRLALFHHDDQYDEGRLLEIGRQAAEHAKKNGYSVEVLMAREGLEIGV